MSHIVTVDMKNVTDLEALAAAAPHFGMELVRDVKNYKWWGHSVGDYPIPEGFTESDLGKCDHVLRVKNNPNAYEIGVVKAKNGRPGYQLIYDFYGDKGRAVKNCVGAKGEKLKSAYEVSYTQRHWQRKGCRVTTTRKENGVVVVEAIR